MKTLNQKNELMQPPMVWLPWVFVKQTVKNRGAYSINADSHVNAFKILFYKL